MKDLRLRFVIDAFALIAVCIAFPPGAKSQPAALSPADLAWIEKCVTDRANNPGTPESLRAYCVCMQDALEDNPELGITELERTYPPLHRACREEAGRKPF